MWVAVGSGVGVGVVDGVAVLVASATAVTSVTRAAVASGSISGASSPQAANATSAAATAMPPITRNMNLPPLLERYPSQPYQMLHPPSTPDCAPRSMRASDYSED